MLAFNYISWPIWRTKRPFVLCKFETDESLEPESSDKQLDHQDEAGNSKQPDTTEPEQVKHIDEHFDKPSKAAVHEVIKLSEFIKPSEKLDKETKLEELKLPEEPSTSAACLKELTKSFFDLSELENLQRH